MNAANAQTRPAAAPARPAFGTVLTDKMSIAYFRDGGWGMLEIVGASAYSVSWLSVAGP